MHDRPIIGEADARDDSRHPRARHHQKGRRVEEGLGYPRRGNTDLCPCGPQELRLPSPNAFYPVGLITIFHRLTLRIETHCRIRGPLPPHPECGMDAWAHRGSFGSSCVARVMDRLSPIQDCIPSCKRLEQDLKGLLLKEVCPVSLRAACLQQGKCYPVSQLSWNSVSQLSHGHV